MSCQMNVIAVQVGGQLESNSQAKFPVGILEHTDK